MAITETLSRIKWGAVAVVIIAIIIILAVYTKFNPFSGITTTLNPVYKGTDALKIRSWVSPDKINLNGRSTAWVDIKNTGEKELSVFVKLKTYDEKLKFIPEDEKETQTINKTMEIGPGESRKLDFKIKLFDAIYGGDYRIDIIANYGKEFEPVEDSVYLHVSE